MFGATPAAAERGDAVLPALALRRGEGLLVLDDPELPRGVRDVRGQRHPVQPRVAAPRRDVRDPQDHPGGGPDRGRRCRRTCTWATSTPCATGATRRSTSRRCGGCCSTTSPTTTSSRRAPRTRSATSSQFSLRARRTSTGRSTSHFDERYLRPTEVDALIGDPTRAGPRARLDTAILTPELANIMVTEEMAHLGQSEGLGPAKQQLSR